MTALDSKIFSSFEAKTHFGQLLRLVEQEQRAVTITHRGRPVARLVPLSEELVETRAQNALERLRQVRAQAKPGESIKKLIAAGRRP